MIKRKLAQRLQALAQQFPAVAVVGPRQSGKTTLAQETFPDYAYVTLEDLDRRMIAQDDPRGFLATYAHHKGLIIDEIQEVPELLSYMQGIIDAEYRPGYFIVTGSQQLLLHEKITQTLAGRIALLTLLPLSIEELKDANLLPSTPEALILKGCYPRLYVQPIEIQTWFAQYINTYIEKDARQVINISDLVTFQRFLKLCAARVGNLLNYSELARDADISPNTAKAWISILETSFIIKLVYPYYNNFNKRVIKSPKLYFYDTAIVCSLLGLKTAEEIALHPIKGALFESLIMSEVHKYFFNNVLQPSIYFWRDVQGHEIDCIIEKSFTHIVPIEIKAGKTITPEFFKNIDQWQDITRQEQKKNYLVYAGDTQSQLKNSMIYSWNNVTEMLDKIMK